MVAVGQQVEVCAEVRQVKVGVTQAHLVKIKDFQTAVDQDVFVMEVFMDGYMLVKFKLRRAFYQVAGNMMSCFGLSWIFRAD